MKYTVTALMIMFFLSSIFIIGCGDDDDDNVGSSKFPPKIEEIQAYGKIITQGTSTPFEVSAIDFDGDPLEFTWEANVGQFDQNTGESVVWTAPETPGDANVTVTVSDGFDTVTGTVNITVQPDQGTESNIIGTWDLISRDNKPLIDYQDKITLVATIEDEEVEFEVTVGYNSEKFTFNVDNSLTGTIKFEYRIPKDSGLPKINNIIKCQAQLTGEYSLSGSQLNIVLPVEQINIEPDYKETQFTDEEKELLEEYLNVLGEEMKVRFSEIEPTDISFQDKKMEWSINWSWEKALVLVEFN